MRSGQNKETQPLILQENVSEEKKTTNTSSEILTTLKNQQEVTEKKLGTFISRQTILEKYALTTVMSSPLAGEATIIGPLYFSGIIATMSELAKFLLGAAVCGGCCVVTAAGCVGTLFYVNKQVANLKNQKNDLTQRIENIESDMKAPSSPKRMSSS